MEELNCKVKEKSVFTVLDLKDGFWHATLDEDEESSTLCTFTTPFGLYKFLKMPFGIKSAPETFQFPNEQAFEGTGAVIYFDDALVAGKDEEHDGILKKIMERAEQENIRSNPSKLHYRKSELSRTSLVEKFDKGKSRKSQSNRCN